MRAGPYGDRFGRDPGGLSLSKLEENPHGVDLGPLKPRLPEVLLTTSQKVELAPPALVADLDRLADHMGGPDHELVLIGRRDPRSHNSWMHNIDTLIGGKPRCTLQVHPDDARKRGLVDNSVVRLSSDLASIEINVEITDAIRPGVVSLPHGWGHAEADTALSRARRSPGVNCNAIIAGPATGVHRDLASIAAI